MIFVVVSLNQKRRERRKCSIEGIHVILLLLLQMAEDTNLQNILMEELSEVDLFCKLIKYPSIRASMLKCFKVTRTDQLI